MGAHGEKDICQVWVGAGLGRTKTIISILGKYFHIRKLLLAAVPEHPTRRAVGCVPGPDPSKRTPPKQAAHTTAERPPTAHGSRRGTRGASIDHGESSRSPPGSAQPGPPAPQS